MVQHDDDEYVNSFLFNCISGVLGDCPVSGLILEVVRFVYVVLPILYNHCYFLVCC